MITYIPSSKNNPSSCPIQVKLEGKRVGTINEVKGGYSYTPLGSRNSGEVFKSIPLVKQSIES